MFGYIYKTTNLINNKIYIGQHKSEKFEPDIYIGSGTLLRRAINKYGEHNFKNELICECFSQIDMDEKEEFWISKLNCTDSSIGYNITNGGRGGSGPRSDETKQKISDWNKNKTVVNDGVICFKINQCDLPEYLSLGYFYGPLPYTRSENFKQKVSKSNTRKIAISKGKIRTRVNPEDIEKYLSDGYNIGWVAQEDRVYYKPKKIPGNGKSKYMHKDNIYLLVPESRQAEFLSDGWIFGGKKGRKKFIHKRGYKLSDETCKRLSESHKGHKNSIESINKGKLTRSKTLAEKGCSIKGRIWICKDNKTKMIKSTELEKFLELNWHKGRK